MPHRTLLLLALLMAAPALGQQRMKMDLLLGHHLGQEHAPGTMIDLFVRGSAGGVQDAVRAHGGMVKMSAGRIASVRMPVAGVRALAAEPAVERLEWGGDRMHYLSDSMRVKAHVNEAHAGLPPLPQGYDGTGVVLGFIDDGLGIDHPDFQLPDGTTRVLHYWDQASGLGAAPDGFGYGSEWSKAQIDAGQLPASLYNGAAHGSPVTGCAAGNARANGRHKGVAPGADLIVVRYSSGSDFRARVADGVKYIFDRAEAAGKPAVVNASLGTYAGSHDGKDAAALLIDSLIAARRGRFMACAAGNAGSQFPFHVRTEVDADTAFTWFTTNANGPQYNIFPYPNLFFEAWADLDALQGVRLAIGADRVLPSLLYRGRTAFHDLTQSLGQLITEPLVSLGGHTLGTVEFLALPRGEQVQIQVRIAQPDSADCLWRLMSTGTGRFDLWTLTTVTATSNVIGPELAAPLGLPFPTPAEYPAMAHYVAPDRDQHIVDSWACSSRTLTAANFWNQTEYESCAGNYINAGIAPYTISGNSSKGPTRDDRLKPDIAAPGDVTMAAAPMAIITDWSATNADKMDELCMHVRGGGTSMASPVVAGVAALYLQKCPGADWQQVRNAILGTAWGDALTGTLPNTTFGMGRIHAFNALVASNMAPVAIAASGDAMCPGDSVLVSAPGGFDAYVWSNGATGNPVHYSGTGPLTVSAAAATGCAASNALTFTLLDPPATPAITADGSHLTSSPGPSYQWYFNGQPIPGATWPDLWASEAGDYAVEHTAANGCHAMSAPEHVLTVGLADALAQGGFATWPTPAEGALAVQLPADAQGMVAVELRDADGRLCLQAQGEPGKRLVLGLDGLAGGCYVLRAQASGRWWSARVVRLP